MPTDGIHGHGTTLSGSGAGAIGQIVSLSIEGVEVDKIDISTMGSTGKWREFIAGMKNPGTLNLELVYEDDLFNTINSSLAVEDTWTITLPDGATAAFSGFLDASGLGIPMDDKVSIPASIKITGPITFTGVTG